MHWRACSSSLVSSSPQYGISMACSSTCKIDDVDSQQRSMNAKYTCLIIPRRADMNHEAKLHVATLDPGGISLDMYASSESLIAGTKAASYPKDRRSGNRQPSRPLTIIRVTTDAICGRLSVIALQIPYMDSNSLRLCITDKQKFLSAEM